MNLAIAPVDPLVVADHHLRQHDVLSDDRFQRPGQRLQHHVEPPESLTLELLQIFTELVTRPPHPANGISTRRQRQSTPTRESEPITGASTKPYVNIVYRVLPGPMMLVSVDSAADLDTSSMVSRVCALEAERACSHIVAAERGSQEAGRPRVISVAFKLSPACSR
jgi:hypothetical protein